MRDVVLDFVDGAPLRYVFSETIDATPEAVFDALSADPATWADWFPGFRRGGYEGPAPYGVGTKRWVSVGRSTYHETMLAWERPTRWTYRVDASNAPLARALVEEWTMTRANGGTRVTWTFAIDPRLAFRAARPLANAVMGRLFRRAMANLELLLDGRRER